MACRALQGRIWHEVQYYHECTLNWPFMSPAETSFIVCIWNGILFSKTPFTIISRSPSDWIFVPSGKPKSSNSAVSQLFALLTVRSLATIGLTPPNPFCEKSRNQKIFVSDDVDWHDEQNNEADQLRFDFNWSKFPTINLTHGPRDSKFPGSMFVLFVPNCKNSIWAITETMGWFNGLFLAAVTSVFLISCAVQPASAISIPIPNISTHQPILERNFISLLAEENFPKCFSLSSSASFSIQRPAKTTNPPTLAMSKLDAEKWPMAQAAEPTTAIDVMTIVNWVLLPIFLIAFAIRFRPGHRN